MTELIPVSEWTWNRYSVKFLDKEGTLIHSTTLVCIENHVNHIVSEKCSEIRGVHTFEWEVLKDKYRKKTLTPEQKIDKAREELSEIYNSGMPHDLNEAWKKIGNVLDILNQP